MPNTKSNKLLRYQIIILFILFFLSRMAFINSQAVFFDSGEYLHLFSISNIISALGSGHIPLHLGYILFFWPVFQTALFLHLNPGNTVVFIQIVLSGLTLFCFYKFVIFISDSRTALLATIIAALLPLYWIVTDTIMMENAYISFFFFSLYFLIQYISNYKKFYYIISLIFLLLSLMTHTMVISWLPFIWVLIFYKARTLFFRHIIATLLTTFLAYVLNILFTSLVTHNNFWTVVNDFYALKNDIAILSFDAKSILVILRDFFIISMRSNTSLVVLLAFASLIQCFRKNKELFFLSILWIIPALYINIWWDGLLPGRYAMLSGFGFAFLTAYLVRNYKFATFLILSYLLFTNIYAINLLRAPIPYIEESHLSSTLPKDSLLIESHFARPQVEQSYKGKLVVVNENIWTTDQIGKEINTYLAKKESVFISAAALSDPYGLYTGPYLHFLSLSYANSPTLKSLLQNYTVVKYKTIDEESNISIYQIISTKKSSYPTIPNLRNSKRRIDYYDPLFRLFVLLQ
ncbi:MAG TPA: hypothetical protein VLF93_06385 [Candidatus Saccharimonadales bacterium]|nr:hypothetical protein [Candidatus Saccharimonadales bacterium]